MKKDKAAADEQKLNAVEQLGQTAKRQAESDGKEVKPKKGKRSGGETLEFLRDKFESESQYRKQELSLRAKEQESGDVQQKIMVELQRVMQQQSEFLKTMQTQQMKQDEQIQSFQIMFLQQQQRKVRF